MGVTTQTTLQPPENQFGFVTDVPDPYTPWIVLAVFLSIVISIAATAAVFAAKRFRNTPLILRAIGSGVLTTLTLLVSYLFVWMWERGSSFADALREPIYLVIENPWEVVALTLLGVVSAFVASHVHNLGMAKFES